MSVLSDITIHKLVENGIIKVDPLDTSLIQPASIDIRASGRFLVFHNSRYPFIDIREPQDDLTEEVVVEGDVPFMLHPGEFVLGSTLETITLPDNVVARLEGKSSLGRLGLVIHSTAGFIDPGFSGTITLELSSSAKMPITLYANMLIGQISFMYMDRTVGEPYGSSKRKSKYQDQSKPTASRMHENFDRLPGGCRIPPRQIDEAVSEADTQILDMGGKPLDLTKCPACGSTSKGTLYAPCNMGGASEAANPGWERFPNAHPWHGIELPT